MHINPELERRVTEHKRADLHKQSAMLHALKESRKLYSLRTGERVFLESSNRMLEMFKRYAQQVHARKSTRGVEALQAKGQNP